MKLFLSVICSLLLLGCQEYDFADLEEKSASACGGPESLPWLRDMINDSYENADSPHCQLWSVEQGIYRRQTVFLMQLGGALCCTCAGASVVDCRGEVIFICEPDKEKKIKKRQTIWERE